MATQDGEDTNAPVSDPRLQSISLSQTETARRRASVAGNGRNRATSLSSRFLESSPPVGMWQATGSALASMPTPMEIRRGDYGDDGWDGELVRRNSNTSSMGGLSRVSSAQTTSQTPATLARTNTSTLGTVKEGESIATGVKGAGVPAQTVAPSSAQGAGDIDDDDDPFSKFIGRGKIDNQSYTPRPKASNEADVDPLQDDDDHDSIDELDPNYRKTKRKTLPKAFIDPDDSPVPVSGNKDALATTVDRSVSTPSTSEKNTDGITGPDENGFYPTGYHFPPKHTWGEATRIGFIAFCKFTITPLGFLIVIYGLNVVAWGGMLFLLLIGGGKEYMCYPPGSHGEKDCNNINSPRRIWIEIDSQILNALFCVTGFGLIPWRFRDLYYLLRFRIQKRTDALRKLAGIHRAWFRLPGSQEVPAMVAAIDLPDAESNTALPIPVTKAPDPPLTGFRAPPTAMWKLDYVIWAYVVNTFLQAVLSGFMWGLNRYNRPSWSTGLFVALACIVAALGGLMCFQEGKKVKAVEGIPISEEERLKDAERGVERSEMDEKATKKKGKSKK